MRKLLLIVLALSFALTISAQGVRFGVKAGGNLSNLTLKEDGTKDDSFKARFGFHFGGVMEYSFSPGFALQPELMLLFNGTNEDGGNGYMNFTQIQVPINFKYKVGTDALKFFVTAGPYLGYALSGRLGSGGVSIDIYSDEVKALMGGTFKRFDFGVGAGIGVEVSKVAFGLNYQYGIANLTDVNKTTAKMGTFLFSVAYFF